MDVVYLLGTGATGTDDWETRISLRSWRKHFAELGTIWIVGHRPGWLDLDHNQIRYIPADDPYRKNKDANLVQKLIRVALTPEVSDHFLFCSDDQGLLKDCVFGDFKPYHMGKIADMKLDAEGSGHRKWQDRMVALDKWLRQRGVLEPLHFDGHIPYPIEKAKVSQLLDSDFGHGGYPIMSLYWNLTGAKGIPINSTNIRGAMYSADEKPHVIDNKLGEKYDNRFYSIGGGSPDCWYLVKRLEERFSDKAPWEIGECRPRWEETLEKAKREVSRLRKNLGDLELIEAAIGADAA